MEAGTQTFLIDEDTSATNFMIRDELMQRVVNRASEPITPFVDRIRELYEEYGVSTILVAGSSGSYFHKADVILQMDCYEPKDITEFARKEAERYPLVTEPVPECNKPDYRRCPAEKGGGQNEGNGGYGRGRGNGRRDHGGKDTGNREERVKVRRPARYRFCE